MSGQVTLKVFEPKKVWHRGLNYRHPLHRAEPDAPLLLLLDDRPAATAQHGQTVSLPVLEGHHTARLVPNAPMFRWLYGLETKPDARLTRLGKAPLRSVARTWPSVRFTVSESEHVVLRMKALKLAIEHPDADVIDADISVTEELPPPRAVDERPASEPPTVELTTETWTVVRQEETVHVDAGAVISVKRVDHVDRTISLVGDATEASLGVSLGFLEASLRHKIRTEPTIQVRSAHTREVEIRLNGDVTTTWAIGFEDHWARAIYRGGGQATPFDFLARTDTFARAINRPTLTL